MFHNLTTFSHAPKKSRERQFVLTHFSVAK